MITIMLWKLWIYRVIKHWSWWRPFSHLPHHLFSQMRKLMPRKMKWLIQSHRTDALFLNPDLWNTGLYISVVSFWHFKTGHVKNGFKYSSLQSDYFERTVFIWKAWVCQQYSSHFCEEGWSLSTVLQWLMPGYLREIHNAALATGNWA